jgi:hypothetical protein
MFSVPEVYTFVLLRASLDSHLPCSSTIFFVARVFDAAVASIRYTWHANMTWHSRLLPYDPLHFLLVAHVAHSNIDFKGNYKWLNMFKGLLETVVRTAISGEVSTLIEDKLKNLTDVNMTNALAKIAATVGPNLKPVPPPPPRPAPVGTVDLLNAWPMALIDVMLNEVRSTHSARCTRRVARCSHYTRVFSSLTSTAHVTILLCVRIA